jgi:hypothetical protein
MLVQGYLAFIDVHVKCHQETPHMLQEIVDLTLCESRSYLQKQQEEFYKIK